MTMRHFAGVVLLTGLFAVTACDDVKPTPASAPAEGKSVASAPAAFSHATQGDLSGYYLPTSEVSAGKYRLTHAFLGQSQEFASWEAGQKSSTFAPVMFEFDDTSSPMVSNELGGEGHSVTVRVLPSTYAVTDDSVRFAGTSPEVGEVTFSGRVDQGALATARRNLGGGEAPVLTGTLHAGGRTFSGLKFTWFGGD